MELGIIGLGKMGFNMAERLRQAGHKVVGFDFNADVVAKLTSDGSKGVNSLEDAGEEPEGAARDLDHGAVGRSGGPDDCETRAFMEKGDTFIDGGNSNYKDSQRRHAEVSGEGLPVHRLRHIGRRVGTEGGLQHDGGRRRRAGRAAAADLRDAGAGQGQGLGTRGTVGSGHFVKMVHNGD